MSDMLLPAPDQPSSDHAAGSAGQPGGAQHGRATRPRASGKVLSKDDCLKALSAIPGLVIMGQIPANRANTLVRVYQAILAQIAERDAVGERAGALDASLVEQVRLNPALLNALSSLLTDEQFAMLDDALQG